MLGEGRGSLGSCRLSGTQGVLIPSANRRHLMLRDAWWRRSALRQFHIWTVEDVDTLLQLLDRIALR